MGRNFQQKAGDLWSEVLLGKYGRGENKRSSCMKNSDSSFWKCLVRNWDKSDDYCKWHIGDGKLVRAWKDNWIQERLNIEDLQRDIPTRIQEASVADLSLDGLTWNWGILVDWLLEDIIWRIEGIPPSSIDAGSGFRIGVGMEGDKYSMSNMYKNLMQNEDIVAAVVWKKIWKLDGMERIRFFVGRMQHDMLLTNQKKARMGLGSVMCRRCGNIEEDTMHVLRDFPIANKLWNAAVLANNNLLFFAGNLKDWIHLNLVNHLGWDSGNQWLLFWANACYFLWFWHNKEEHDDNYNRPVDDYGLIKRQIHQYKEAKRTHVVATAPNMKENGTTFEKLDKD